MATKTTICIHFKYNPIFLFCFIVLEIAPAKKAIVEKMMKETIIKTPPNT